MTPSVFTVIAAAAVATGKPFKEAQYLADAAWPKLEALKPNILNLYSTDDAALLVSQGQGVIGGPEYSKYVYPYKLKGASIDMCFPKEGPLPASTARLSRTPQRRPRRRVHEPHAGCQGSGWPGSDRACSALDLGPIVQA